MPIAWQAFIQAWNTACKSSTWPSKLVIPLGWFMVRETIYQEPHLSTPMTVEIQGTILANSNMSEFISRECLLFQDIDGLKVLNGGSIDGQGQSAWKYSNYRSTDNCDSPLPIVSSQTFYVNAIDIEKKCTKKCSKCSVGVMTRCNTSARDPFVLQFGLDFVSRFLIWTKESKSG